MAGATTTPHTAPRFDVLGLGIVTIDDLLYAERYPEAEAKVAVLQRLRQGGGLTGTALVAAARLGSRCAYAGVLDDGEMSTAIRQILQAEGIDLSHVHPRLKRAPIHSTIIVDTQTQSRTIFFEKDPSPYHGADWPEAGLIQSSRVLFLDHDHAERGLRAAGIARTAGIPIVADYERSEAPGFADLLALTDHPILSRDFATRLTGESDPSQAVRALWTDARDTVVVTCGDQGCWALDRSMAGTPRHWPAYPVPVVDTTGCGDVFHGAYASALARGLDLDARLRFAAAAAALKAGVPGGQAGIPTRAQVETFLQGLG